MCCGYLLCSGLPGRFGRSAFLFADRRVVYIIRSGRLSLFVVETEGKTSQIKVFSRTSCFLLVVQVRKFPVSCYPIFCDLRHTFASSPYRMPCVLSLSCPVSYILLRVCRILRSFFLTPYDLFVFCVPFLAPVVVCILPSYTSCFMNFMSCLRVLLLVPRVPNLVFSVLPLVLCIVYHAACHASCIICTAYVMFLRSCPFRHAFCVM